MLKFPDQYPTKNYKMFYMLLSNGFERVYIAKDQAHSLVIFKRVCSRQNSAGLVCSGYN